MIGAGRAPAVASVAPQPLRSAWRERWLAFRNGCIASPRFQRWAADFPLTKRIARRSTRALFDLCAGFVYSQVLQACIRLDLFRHLEQGPRSVSHLSRHLDLTEERASRLFKAAASLDLVRMLPDGRVALADLGAALLANPSISAMIEHHALLYADLGDPVALLRGEGGPTRLGAFWLYADHGKLDSTKPDGVAAYGSLMSASQAMLAQDVLDAASLGGIEHLMDVGGGEGAFAAAAARRHTNLRLTLFDLPPVAERAAATLAAAGLGDRVTCRGGNFHADPLPRAGAISLVRILHDHDDADAMALVRAAYDALLPGGLLLIAEPLSGTPGGERIGDAYFGFYLLAMGSGRARCFDELVGMLAGAGFAEIREKPTRRPLLMRLITAKRPLKV